MTNDIQNRQVGVSLLAGQIVGDEVLIDSTYTGSLRPLKSSGSDAVQQNGSILSAFSEGLNALYSITATTFTSTTEKNDEQSTSAFDGSDNEVSTSRNAGTYEDIEFQVDEMLPDNIDGLQEPETGAVQSQEENQETNNSEKQSTRRSVLDRLRGRRAPDADKGVLVSTAKKLIRSHKEEINQITDTLLALTDDREIKDPKTLASFLDLFHNMVEYGNELTKPSESDTSIGDLLQSDTTGALANKLTSLTGTQEYLSDIGKLASKDYVEQLRGLSVENGRDGAVIKAVRNRLISDPAFAQSIVGSLLVPDTSVPNRTELLNVVSEETFYQIRERIVESETGLFDRGRSTENLDVVQKFLLDNVFAPNDNDLRGVAQGYVHKIGLAVSNINPSMEVLVRENQFGNGETLVAGESRSGIVQALSLEKEVFLYAFKQLESKSLLRDEGLVDLLSQVDVSRLNSEDPKYALSKLTELNSVFASKLKMDRSGLHQKTAT